MKIREIVDVLAIPFFFALSFYFYNIPNKTPIEYVFYIFLNKNCVHLNLQLKKFKRNKRYLRLFYYLSLEFIKGLIQLEDTNMSSFNYYYFIYGVIDYQFPRSEFFISFIRFYIYTPYWGSITML